MSGQSPGGEARLREIVLGQDRSEERLAYFRAIMSLGRGGSDPAGRGELGPAEPEDLALAQAIMAGFGQVPVGTARRRLGSLKAAAASRLRAEATCEPGLRQARGEVTVHATKQAFVGFFAVEVARLSHRRFDGSMSPIVQREVFLSCDAVTVLPYDPVRDRVLVIEQMRMGPLGRGDPLPWQIEAIAGRIDAGESPEDCARREAVEEAGLQLGRLEKVAGYYPSPGALAEYLYSYVALCDLPDAAAGVFGVAAEVEDIRGMLLSHADLMAAVARGDIANAPLLLTALWLDRERSRLRSGAG